MRYISQVTHKFYDCSHFDADMLRVYYAETNLSKSEDDSDLNDKFDKFLLNLLGPVNKHCQQSRKS